MLTFVLIIIDAASLYDGITMTRLMQLLPYQVAMWLAFLNCSLLKPCCILVYNSLK